MHGCMIRTSYSCRNRCMRTERPRGNVGHGKVWRALACGPVPERSLALISASLYCALAHILLVRVLEQPQRVSQMRRLVLVPLRTAGAKQVVESATRRQNASVAESAKWYRIGRRPQPMRKPITSDCHVFRSSIGWHKLS